AAETRARGRGGRWAVGAAVAVAGALAAAAAGLASDAPAPAFFAAGALALAGGVAAVRALMGRLSTASTPRLTIATLGARNAARRPGRAVAAAAMLACGAFMVVAVSAMKEDLGRQAGRRDSGTGGFALVGDASVAVHHDLNTARGREALRLSEEDLAGASVVPVKVREGDDASCLNLNLSLSPPLLGIDPDAMGKRGAFGPAELWGTLREPLPDGVVAGLVGDSATALWKLRKKVGPDGDVLDYRDERGRPFKVKLVGQIPSRLSVFQGRVLVASRDFLRLYPSESGWRMFLVDAPAGRVEAVDRALTSRLETYGLDLAPPVERLRRYYEVESAYLSMFLVLGGLGLLLGSAGMGILVLRSVLERRSELALLTAVGYTKPRAAAVVVAEHRLLLLAGLAAGTAAAALAIAPSVARPDVEVPYGLLAVFLAGTALLGLGWIWAAARVALRGPLVAALRNE
ncbi:MAG TPA: FtsX-like permease family protein, partial [Planctomycetota bacterium]|nr:FtsX-like permease family protein [Planctomycetota bacterium]